MIVPPPRCLLETGSSFLSVLMKFPKLPRRVRYIKSEPSPSRLLIDYKRLVLFPRKFAREERFNVSSDRPGAVSMKGRKTGERGEIKILSPSMPSCLPPASLSFLTSTEYPSMATSGCLQNQLISSASYYEYLWLPPCTSSLPLLSSPLSRLRLDSFHWFLLVCCPPLAES